MDYGSGNTNVPRKRRNPAEKAAMSETLQGLEGTPTGVKPRKPVKPMKGRGRRISEDLPPYIS